MDVQVVYSPAPGPGGTDIINTDFGASFPTGAAETTMDTDLANAANRNNAAYLHEPSKDWAAINAGYTGATVGGVRADKTATFPQISFTVSGLSTSTVYEFDFGLVIGASSTGDAAGDLTGDVFFRIGTSAFNGSLFDTTYVRAGQPRFESVTAATFNTGVNTTVYFTFGMSSATGGVAGGDPILSHFALRLQ